MDEHRARQSELKKLFDACDSTEARYEKIIALGKQLPQLDSIHKTADNLVHGCQSLMYLHVEEQNGLLSVRADSDALISKGLAALLIKIYNEQPPEIILTQPPTILEEIGIYAALSPTRVNGLHSFYLKLKQSALKFLS